METLYPLKNHVLKKVIIFLASLKNGYHFIFEKTSIFFLKKKEKKFCLKR